MILLDVLNAQNCASEAVEEYRRALIGATSSAEKEKIQSSMIPLLRVLGSDERKSNKEESKRWSLKWMKAIIARECYNLSVARKIPIIESLSLQLHKV